MFRTLGNFGRAASYGLPTSRLQPYASHILRPVSSTPIISSSTRTPGVCMRAFVCVCVLFFCFFYVRYIAFRTSGCNSTVVSFCNERGRRLMRK